jgi:hypothetical protein
LFRLVDMVFSLAPWSPTPQVPDASFADLPDQHL